MSTDAESVAAGIIDHLEQAWNAADGRAFGAPFTADADFVDIRGDHHRSSEAIAAGHQGILDSIYRGSSMTYKLTQARNLSDDVIVAHSFGTLTAPTGPLAGVSNATMSLTIVRDGDDWKIASVQNTLVAQR